MNAGASPPAERPEGSPPDARRARSPLRRVVLGLLVSLGALLVTAAALEVALRLRDVEPDPLFIIADGRVSLAPGHPGFVPVGMTEKSGRLRIVSMGASTIVGVPYEPVLSPPRWLGFVLERRGVKADIVTVAAPGLASAGLLALLPEVLALNPDALIIATGHNEYLAATQLLRERWWHSLRLGQLAALWLGEAAEADELLPTPEHGFDHAAVTENFRRNIRAMQALADDAGVPFLLCAEVSNLADFPPVLGDDPTADEDADAAYARGQVLLEAGDKAGALAAFERARDRDRWPHRANSALNAAVAAEARRYVALDRLFAEQSRSGVPGFDLFADHCHPNPAGQRLMALGIADALEDLKLFPLTGRRGTGPSLEEGLKRFGADAGTLARADAQVGRAFMGFALMRGEPGPLAREARRLLQSAQDDWEGRAGEVLASLALLDLLDGDRLAARTRIDACRKVSPAAMANLQRLHDTYPWVKAVFERNEMLLRRGDVLRFPP